MTAQRLMFGGMDASQTDTAKQPMTHAMGGLHMEDGLKQAIAGLKRYGPQANHWTISLSGGKDSTALFTVVLWAIESGVVPRPASGITVINSDTRQEQPALAAFTASMLGEARRRGCAVRVVQPPVEDRFFVRILGRGYPPPGAVRMRWCTRLLKQKPMIAVQREIHAAHNGSVLVLYGSRVDESSARGQRIAASCTLEGAECGQGLFQQLTEYATYAPLANWRNCAVWDWLSICKRRTGIDVSGLSDMYFISSEEATTDEKYLSASRGDWDYFDELIDANSRSGCIGCPVVSHDFALDRICTKPEWSYLTPLKELRPLYWELRAHKHRLRMPPGEKRKDGSRCANQCRVGPLQIASREWAMEKILGIQRRVNTAAAMAGRPEIALIDREEEAVIRKMIAGRVFPRKWSGDELAADEIPPNVLDDGSIQRPLFT
jgi:DNA sulfur modification protein DndC